jgi:hypothetical protein
LRADEVNICYQPPVRKRLRARDEVRAVVEEEWPELAHKLPPKGSINLLFAIRCHERRWATPPQRRRAA